MSSRVKQALASIQQYEPAFYELICLVITTIFSTPSKLAGGGSTSAAIGCIWVNLRKHWQEQDVIEFLVHETTHNLVFLDELCYKHYDYEEISKKENYAWSAILNKPRPLDKVFHSIIVSTEVLLFRNEILSHPNNSCLHPPTDVMLEQTKYSISYIKNNPRLCSCLTARAHELLDICENKLKSIVFSKVA